MGGGAYGIALNRNRYRCIRIACANACQTASDLLARGRGGYTPAVFREPSSSPRWFGVRIDGLNERGTGEALLWVTASRVGTLYSPKPFAGLAGCALPGSDPPSRVRESARSI